MFLIISFLLFPVSQEFLCILVKSVPPNDNYRIIDTENNLLGNFTGKDLIEDGFSIMIQEPNSASVFELQRTR